MEKRLDGNYTILRTILNKSWRQHPTNKQLYGHLPPITKTIKVRRTRHAGHCWRSRDELISDVLLWTPSHGRAKAGQPARTYIQQLCADTGCSPEDLPEAMDDREVWWERVKDIRADGVTWWWWWWWSYIYDLTDRKNFSNKSISKYNSLNPCSCHLSILQLLFICGNFPKKKKNLRPKLNQISHYCDKYLILII